MRREGEKIELKEHQAISFKGLIVENRKSDSAVKCHFQL